MAEIDHRKIAIIGHFGGPKDFADGQTIKTKILYQELKKATDWDIRKVDTYYKNVNPLKLVWDSLKCVCTCKDIVVLLSGNGMKLYFPFLSFFSRCFGTRIYHDVIGGNLDAHVKQTPHFQKYLNSFRVNWVETERLRLKMEQCGVHNCAVLPNFKRLKLADLGTQNRAIYEHPPYRFCTFSRVMREKGIEDAVEAVRAINREWGKEICRLDIYGKVDDGYTTRFQEVLENAPAGVRYGGIVPFDKSAEILKDYYALLFPTSWPGEGFPGTLVDAFSAGLPVIATDWNCNTEIVADGQDGIVYPNGQIQDLKQAMQWAIGHPDEMWNMRQKCLEKAEKFQPESYIVQIVKEIEEK